MQLKERMTNLIYSKNNRNLATLDRDIEIVLSYFGLGNISYPSFQSVADQYDMGSRQRVKQIIEQKFTSKISAMELDVVLTIQEIIESNKIHFISDLSTEFIRRNVINDDINIKGLLNLIQSMGICKDYEILNLDLTKPSKYDLEIQEEFLMLTDIKSMELNQEFKRVKTYPGKYGMCRLGKIFELGEVQSVDFETMKRLIALSPDSWTIQDDDGVFWYLFENKDNVIINSLEKLANIATNIEIKKLSNMISRLLRRRSLPLGAPSEVIVEKYLTNSKFTSISEHYVSIDVKPTELLRIEKDILNYFQTEEGEYFTYNQIRNYLLSLNYSNPYIVKEVFNSPFIYVEGEMKNYKFSLASRYSKNIKVENEYELFKRRLKNLYGITDQTSDAKRRREQHILSEWLFEGKTHLKCAICGKLFSVKSLVTAHKKKRSLCSENERTDPNIVMPLCLFGCDYLYENRLITIVNGMTEANIIENLTQEEKDRLNAIQGLRLQEEWLKGSIDYFS